MRNVRINPGHAAEHRKNSKTAAEETGNAEHVGRKLQKKEDREGWLCQGWLWVTRTLSASIGCLLSCGAVAKQEVKSLGSRALQQTAQAPTNSFWHTSLGCSSGSGSDVACCDGVQSTYVCQGRLKVDYMQNWQACSYTDPVLCAPAEILWKIRSLM